MSSGNHRQQWRELAIEKKLSIVVVPIAIAAISVGIPLLAQGGGSPAPTPTPAPAGKLEVVDLAVTGGHLRANDLENTQAIDITVRNTGDVVSVVTRARLVVRDTGFLENCQAGGGLEASERYDVLLPGEVAKGETFEAKVSQQILPGTADRFELRLDVKEPDRQLGLYLYQFDVHLLHDAAPEPLPAGTVVVSVPYMPAHYVFWSGTEFKDSFQGPGSAEVKQCLQDNEAAFERMVALDGERSPELTRELLEPQ